MADIELDKASERIDAGEKAGSEYVEALEDIRDALDDDQGAGTQLGTMVSAQLKMTETETEYMVKSGIPKKVSQAVMTAANDVKKAGGG